VTHEQAPPELQSDNRTIMRKLVVVAVLMFGFGWALVPLYRKICEITGINIVDAGCRHRARRPQCAGGPLAHDHG
jgi:cytochrome c oxidase assembly protein Cox11